MGFLKWLWATYETLSFYQWLVVGGGMSVTPIVGGISDWPVWVQLVASAGVAFVWLTVLKWLIDRFKRKPEVAPVGDSQELTRSPRAGQAGDIGRDNIQVAGDFILVQNFYISSDSPLEEVGKEGP